MKLREIRPMGGGRFVSRYDLAYTMHNGREKIYEMVSRRPVKGLSDLADAAPDGVVLIILNEARSRVLLNREFRPAVGKVVYNFPAGLIDAGETAEQAAARELRRKRALRSAAIWRPTAAPTARWGSATNRPRCTWALRMRMCRSAETPTRPRRSNRCG